MATAEAFLDAPDAVAAPTQPAPVGMKAEAFLDDGAPPAPVDYSSLGIQPATSYLNGFVRPPAYVPLTTPTQQAPQHPQGPTRQDLISQAGEYAAGKAFSHGLGKGSAITLGFLGGGAGGTALGAELGPGAMLTGLAGGIGGGIAAGKAYDELYAHLAQSNPGFASYLAASATHPGYDLAGQVAPIVLDAPLAVGNLWKGVALVNETQGPKAAAAFAAKVLGTGAVAGGATDAAFRSADALITPSQPGEPSKWPTLGSTALGAGMGALLGGNAVGNKNFSMADLFNISMKMAKGEPISAADAGALDTAVKMHQQVYAENPDAQVLPGSSVDQTSFLGQPVASRGNVTLSGDPGAPTAPAPPAGLLGGPEIPPAPPGSPAPGETPGTPITQEPAPPEATPAAPVQQMPGPGPVITPPPQAPALPAAPVTPEPPSPAAPAAPAAPQPAAAPDAPTQTAEGYLDAPDSELLHPDEIAAKYPILQQMQELVGSHVHVELHDGSSYDGIISETHGHPWINHNGNVAVTAFDAPGIAQIKSLTVTKSVSQAIDEKNQRKYGEIVYKQPRTREEYELTLNDLAARIRQERKSEEPGHVLRYLQLEAQFNKVADEIGLAKNKRYFLLRYSGSFAGNVPFPQRPWHLSDAADQNYAVPKPSDFDPDPAVRAKRTPANPANFLTLAQVKDSLERAQSDLLNKRMSADKKARWIKIVAARKDEIAKGLYYEEQLKRFHAFHASGAQEDPNAVTEETAADPESESESGEAAAPLSNFPDPSSMQYHGARKPISGDLQEGYYNPDNIYGGENTFYTTSDLDVAQGYGRKNPNSVVYQVKENHPVKFYDMEKQMPVTYWHNMFKHDYYYDNLIAPAIEDVSVSNKGSSNLRQIMDEIRASSGSQEISKEEVQEIFSSLAHELSKEGYGGLTHIGGLKTGRAAHTVKIYFEPHKQISLQEIHPAASVPAPKTLTATESEAVQEETKTPEVVKQSEPFDPAAARGQKKFLLSAIDQAIAKAPEEETAINNSPKAQEILADIKAMEEIDSRQGLKPNERTDLLAPFYDKYRNGRNGEIYKSRKALDKELDARVHRTLPKISIQVPGDGLFHINNTIQALSAFRAQANKFPVTFSKPDDVTTTGRTTPKAIPKLGKPTKENILSALSQGCSDDKTRPVLHNIWSDGNQSASTNGALLIVIDHGISSGPAVLSQSGVIQKKIAPSNSEHTSNHDAHYPNWKQILPKMADYGKIATIDTARLAMICNQAQIGLENPGSKSQDQTIGLYLNPDGTLGARAIQEVPSLEHKENKKVYNEYEHNFQGGSKLISHYKVPFLSKITAAARIVGSEKLDLYLPYNKNDGQQPLVIQFKDGRSVLMPVRVGGDKEGTLEGYAQASRDLSSRKKADGSPASREAYPQPDSPEVQAARQAKGVPPKQAPSPSPAPPDPNAPKPAPLGNAPAAWTAAIRSGMTSMIQTYLNPVQRILFPSTLDAHASWMANYLRDLNGHRAIDMVRADEALARWRNAFDRTPVPQNWKYDPNAPLPPNFAFIHAIETGRFQYLSPELQALARECRAQLDSLIDQIHAIDPSLLQTLQDNWFARGWKQPDAPARFAAVPAGKPLEGSKGFLKKRTLEYFTDGLARGLTPISDNPVDIHLFKVGEMLRFLMARRALMGAEKAGLRKFVGIFSKKPEGWSVVDDPSSVKTTPFVTVKEAFDLQLRKGALDLIEKMGWNYERTLINLRKKGFERNVQGFWQPSTKSIKQRNFTTDATLFHEIGHGLDSTYGLESWLERQITPEVLKAEMKALADARDPEEKLEPEYRNSASENIAEMCAAYIHAPELLQAKAPQMAAAFVKFLDAHPELHDFRDLRPSMERSQEYVSVPAHGMVTLGHYYMPDGAAQVMTNYLSPGLSQYGWYRGIHSISNLLNAANLGFSAFHLGFTSLDAMSSQLSIALWQALHLQPIRATISLAKVPIAPVYNAIRGIQLQRAMINPDKASPAMKALAEMALQGGMRATMDPFWKTHFTRSLVRACHGIMINLKEGSVPACECTTILTHLIPSVIEQTMRPIAEYVVPWQKLGVMAELLELEMRRLGPDATPAMIRAAAARCADTTEDRLGQLTYDNLFHNSVAKDLLMISFRAYGWQYGKYRAMTSALGEGAGAVNSLRQGKAPVISTNFTYPMALGIVMAVMGGITMKLLSGKNPQNAFDLLNPQTGKLDARGRPYRVVLPSYLKDLETDYHDFPDLKKMGSTFANKLNPLLALTVDMFENRDFYNVEIRHTDDPALMQAGQVTRFLAKSFIPFSVAGTMKMASQGASLSEMALPFVGVVPAKAALSMTPAEVKAQDLYVGTLPQGSKTQDQFDHSQMVDQIKQNLNQGKGQAAKDLLIHNAPNLRISDMKQIFAPSGGQVVLVNQVMQLSLAQGMSVFDIATNLERQELAPVLFRKLGAAVNNHAIQPDLARHYAQALAKPR